MSELATEIHFNTNALHGPLPAARERERHEKIPSDDGRSMTEGVARVVAVPPSSSERATVLCLTTEL